MTWLVPKVCCWGKMHVYQFEPMKQPSVIEWTARVSVCTYDLIWWNSSAFMRFTTNSRKHTFNCWIWCSLFGLFSHWNKLDYSPSLSRLLSINLWIPIHLLLSRDLFSLITLPPSITTCCCPSGVVLSLHLYVRMINTQERAGHYNSTFQHIYSAFSVFIIH